MPKKVKAAKVIKAEPEAAVKVDRRQRFRDKKLFPEVTENPFKRGWGHTSFEKIAAEPGKTFKEYVDEGGRIPAISHAIRVGWLRAED
jgi:hypothetical protein